MRITFAGAAGTVTGSRYLVEGDSARVLVDCGLYQGIKSLRARNWAAPRFAAAQLDAVVLTHAHIDHSGYLPRLIKAGFRGRVYCTEATQDLLAILLPDAGFLQEEEARFAAKHGFSRHHPPLPLYTRADAEAALAYLTPVKFDAEFAPAAGFSALFTRAGHILGSACLRLTERGTRVAFSGDVGRSDDLILKPPAKLPPCDHLVVESTYGDRRHPQEDVFQVVETVVSETAARGGTVVVPAFAVGRAQHLLYVLSVLKEQRRIPALPIYLDSPMAISATEIFMRHPEEHKLSASECERLFEVARYTRTPEESRAIDASLDPSVVVSASGMATGGRVLHHLRRFLPDERNTVLLVGFQAAGTRGRALFDGTDELKLHGQYVRVRARIARLEGLSAHADYAEIIDWLRDSGVAPRRVFVTHGEPGPADALRRRLRDQLGFEAAVPDYGDVVQL